MLFLPKKKNSVLIHFPVSVNYEREESFNENSCQDYRQTVIFSSGGASSTTPFQSPLTNTDKSLAHQQQFRNERSFIGNEGGTLLVDREPSSKRRERTELSIPRSSYSIGCLKRRLGEVCRG